MKKIFLLSTIILIFICSNCFAKSVQVTGQGMTERAAIHNAMRAAIEQELGTFIDAKTLTRNHEVIEDEIYSKSEGFVSSYEIISQRVEDEIYFVEIKAEVNSGEVKTHLMSKLQKKVLINTNLNNPRVAVFAYDSAGNEYSEVENEIFSALKSQGFSYTIDLAQVQRAVNNRIIFADNDPALRKTLANDFHIDYLVLAEVKYFTENARNSLALSSRLINVNTGKIVYAGNSDGNVGMFTANVGATTLKLAARRAGFEISRAALNSAAQVEQNITLLITQSTFNRIGGNLSAINNFAKKFDGVNDAFVRNMRGNSVQVDINFDGTATDLAAEIERAGFKIIEVTSDYIKI